MGDGMIRGRRVIENGPDLDLIKKWMSTRYFGCGVEWRTYDGTRVYSRPEMFALIDSARLTIERYSDGAIFGALDGEPVHLLVPLFHYGTDNCVGNCDETNRCGYGPEVGSAS